MRQNILQLLRDWEVQPQLHRDASSFSSLFPPPFSSYVNFFWLILLQRTCFCWWCTSSSSFHSYPRGFSPFHLSDCSNQCMLGIDRPCCYFLPFSQRLLWKPADAFCTVHSHQFNFFKSPFYSRACVSCWGSVLQRLIFTPKPICAQWFHLEMTVEIT